MKQYQVQNINSGSNLCSLVFAVFLALKLAEIGVVAGWSWWWVTAPLWIPITLIVSLFLIVFIVILLNSIINKFVKRVE